MKGEGRVIPALEIVLLFSGLFPAVKIPDFVYLVVKIIGDTKVVVWDRCFGSFRRGSSY